jgi:hypothetical protein
MPPGSRQHSAATCRTRLRRKPALGHPALRPDPLTNAVDERDGRRIEGALVQHKFVTRSGRGSAALPSLPTA